MNIEKIILDNYMNNKENINDYFNHFKKYGIRILALRTDKRSGILKQGNRKIDFYILNNKIEVNTI